jgi:hypothetical protein
MRKAMRISAGIAVLAFVGNIFALTIAFIFSGTEM